MIAAELLVIHDLEPRFRDLIRQVIAYADALYQGSRYRLTVSSYALPGVPGRRTAKEQAAEYAAGHTDCDGVRKVSKHQTGEALHLGVRVRATGAYVPYDTLPADEIHRFMLVVLYAEARGIVWGGRWTKGKAARDFEHFEMGKAGAPDTAPDDFYKPV